MTYRDAGVDVGRIRTAQKSIGEIISATHKLLATGRVVSGFGHYAGLVRLGSQLLALHSDGVGTKVLVAQLMNKFDTIGIDCVAMNVNDVICVGAQPVGFIDYVALCQPNERLVQEIARGLVEGARQSRMAGMPAAVPGILTIRFGRSIAFHQRCASSAEAFVSQAMSGLTSTETYPSSPFVRSNTGRNRSAARRMSSIMMASSTASGSMPVPAALMSSS